MSRTRRLATAGALLTAMASAAQSAAAQGPAPPADTVARFPAYPGDSTGLAAGAPYEVRVHVDVGRPGARRFDLRTTASQRAGDPQARTIQEAAGRPFLASGSVLFDALFAQAVDDARQASVAEIRDGSYNEGRPIPCQCFETGEKWHYVWTRDLSYALDLGLVGLDPQRAVASLLFKTSGFRPGVPVPAELPDSAEQIIQDTGSGGRWPVSTDRVVWALGAERTLAELAGPAREDFARRAYRALRGTVEADRVAAFDVRDGLYGGEHSFLDWREQSYPGWVVDDLTAIAQFKTLSTNVGELRALHNGAPVAAGDLRAVGDRVEVRFGAPRLGRDSVTAALDVPARSHNNPTAFMPHTPVVAAARAGDGGVPLAVSSRDPRRPGLAGVSYWMFRDGRRVALGLLQHERARGQRDVHGAGRRGGAGERGARGGDHDRRAGGGASHCSADEDGRERAVGVRVGLRPVLPPAYDVAVLHAPRAPAPARA